MPDPRPITVFDVIRAGKQSIECGSWKEGAIPRAQFPLARSKLSLGRGWKWRIVSFNALGHSFLVLVALNLEKEYYRATLGLRDGKSLKIICCHELHTDHWNWHCHVISGNVHHTYPGVLRDKERMMVWPSFSRRECGVPFNVTEESALSVAAARFRFTLGGGFL